MPPEKAVEWREHIGNEVIFGIRPEDIHSKEYAPPQILESDMAATVDVTELMGNEIFLYCLSTDSKQFISRVDPRVRVSTGDDIELAVNMNNAHIFDPKTEAEFGRLMSSNEKSGLRCPLSTLLVFHRFYFFRRRDRWAPNHVHIRKRLRWGMPGPGALWPFSLPYPDHPLA